MPMQKLRKHVLMHRSLRVLPRVCNTSMVCPLLAARGWRQFKNDVLMHEDTDQDIMFAVGYESP